MPPRPRDPPTDVVVIGSGVAGSSCAHALRRAGLNVIVLEAGPRLDRSDLVQRYESAVVKDLMSPYPDVAHAPEEIMQEGPHHYRFKYVRAVGGTTWHWAAVCWRFLPSDFELHGRYGVGRDWPFGYDVLEPYYQRAEEELGVAGSDGEDIGSPRRRPYPMPPVPLSYMDVQVQTILNEAGYRMVGEPVARNTIDYDGRPPCCGSSSCMPICPIGAQYSGDVHAAKAEAAGARLVTHALVDRIEVGADRVVTAVRYRTPDGAAYRVAGRAFVIAANGIETPRLLLASRSDWAPNGVANSSDQVGRNLMDHPSTWISFLMPRPVFPGRGPQEITAIINLRDGPFRSMRSAKKLHLSNRVDTLGITRALLTQGLNGSALDRAIYERSVRSCRMESFHEQVPDPANRIVLSLDRRDRFGLPYARVHYALDEYVRRSATDTRRTFDDIARLLGASEVRHAEGLGPVGHPMGTTIMGNDPGNSVADAWGRAHDHPNLFIVGSSLFPSGGTVNPTLTIAALSLRTADAISREFGGIVR
jgi:choline dehydrogenase-like flavoprotein